MLYEWKMELLQIITKERWTGKEVLLVVLQILSEEELSCRSLGILALRNDQGTFDIFSLSDISPEKKML